MNYYSFGRLPGRLNRSLASIGTGLALLLALPTLAQPTVSSVSPVRNQRSVPRAGNVSFTLSQPISAGSAGALKVFSSRRGGLLNGTATVSGNTVTFDPATDFQPGETVQATLTTAVQNTSGQALDRGQAFSFMAAATNGSGVFSAAPSLTVPTSGKGPAVGDINGDGLMDIVVAAGNNTVATFLNQGGGVFPATASASVATGSNPNQVALADVDNDGDLDAMIPGYEAHGVSVHRNVGGVLGAATLLRTGEAPRMVAVVDVNGDGFLDILTTTISNSPVWLSLNNAGTFAAATPLSFGGVVSFTMAAADLNGDGNMDVITANNFSKDLSVRMGTGTGTFFSPSTISLGVSLFGIALGDLNGDHIPDVVTCYSDGLNVIVALGVGNGTFGTPFNVATGGANSKDVALADVDADGDLDLVVANYTSDNVSVVPNNGSATFGTPTVYATSANPGISANPVALATGDIDGDGDLDIVCSSPNSTVVTVLRNGPVPTATTWTGNVSTDWFTAGNWTDGVPTSTLDATIPVGRPRYPVLTSGTASVLSLTLNTGGMLTQSGGTLTLNKDLTNNGTFTATGGVVSFVGSDEQHLYGSRTTFWDLSVLRSLRLLTAADVQRVLTLDGNLATNNQALTLLSNATATAMVVHNGTGQVNGNVTVQRYIDPSLYAGTGYRHYSSPVQDVTVGDLYTAQFSPIINPDYNTLGNTVNPFPNVYGYDEARLTSASATSQDFVYGYFSPTSLTDQLVRGRGYTVNINASEKVELTGPLNTGDVAVGALTRGTQLNSGWQLLGNPYPAPLDWKKARMSLPAGVLDAIYVYKPLGRYDGTYQFYQNGVGTLPSGLVGSMQGFFVKVSQTVPAFSFQNTWRATSYADPSFNRATAETRPLVQLDLVSAEGVHEPAYVYFEDGATAGMDNHFDAEKLPNTTGLNLASVAAGTGLAINGLPRTSTATVVPLSVGVPTTGTYSLQAAALLNLGSTPVFLHDALTGQQINLQQQSSYSFSASNAALISGRFSLHFSAAAPLSTKNGFTAASVSLYPNPAHGSVTVGLPAVSGQSQAKLTLYSVLGQPVRDTTVVLPAAGVQTPLDVQGLPVGVYVLRIQVGTTSLTKQLVVN